MDDSWDEIARRFHAAYTRIQSTARDYPLRPDDSSGYYYTITELPARLELVEGEGDGPVER